MFFGLEWSTINTKSEFRFWQKCFRRTEEAMQHACLCVDHIILLFSWSHNHIHCLVYLPILSSANIIWHFLLDKMRVLLFSMMVSLWSWRFTFHISQRNSFLVEYLDINTGIMYYHLMIVLAVHLSGIISHFGVWWILHFLKWNSKNFFFYTFLLSWWVYLCLCYYSLCFWTQIQFFSKWVQVAVLVIYR